MGMQTDPLLDLVKHLIKREVQTHYRNVTQAAEAMFTSKQTLHRWMNQDDGPIPDNQHPRIERALNMPRGTIQHLLAGDAKWFAALPPKNESNPDGLIEADLQRYVLELLATAKTSSRRRQAR